MGGGLLLQCRTDGLVRRHAARHDQQRGLAGHRRHRMPRAIRDRVAHRLLEPRGDVGRGLGW